MTILIVGSGAREHALAATLARSDESPSLYCLGTHRNPGIEALCAEPITVGDITDTVAAVRAARDCTAGLVCIGPEAPLATGVTDALEDAGFPVVGPRQEPARIETSKSFCRDLLHRVCPEAIPTYFTVTNEKEAAAALERLGDAYVVKADGLAGGKGVKVAGDHLHSREEALAYCREVLADSSRVVIEEKLIGQEFSLLSFTDGYSCLHMPAVQDHKRAYADDRGPNTGGMGSYSDSDGSLPFLGRQDVAVAQRLNERVVRGIRDQTSVPYRGILYGGFMAGVRGPAIVEYNARFGDPEALNLLPLLETDLIEIFRAIVSGTLDRTEARFTPAASVCKYLVPPGYPECGEKGLVLDLPEEWYSPPAGGHTRGTDGETSPGKTSLFLGSAALRDGRLVTEGSRTLAVTGTGENLETAERGAESVIDALRLPLTHRRDIGTRALIDKRIAHMRSIRSNPLRVGVLGSTRGTSVQRLIEEAETFQIPASIEVVITDREHAPILERAARHRIPSHFLDPRTADGTRKPRQRYDRDLVEILNRYRVDLVLCVGFMRILSEMFCDAFHERALNVHPSLLPEFAGGTDMDVHAAVIASGRDVTGCTVHYITPEVDAGPILVQSSCAVTPEDTPETLKARVQTLEAAALVEAVERFRALSFSDEGARK